MSDRTVSIVVPVHDNASTLRELVERLVIALGTQLVEIVLVDDSSTDESLATAREIGEAHAVVRSLELPGRHGQHAAVRAGISQTVGDVVGVLDADLQDRPEDLLALLAQLSTGVVAAGRRGRYETWPRLLSGRVARVLLWALSRRRLPYDAGMCFVAEGGRARAALAAGRDDDHVLARLARSGMVVRSVPLIRDTRADGASSYDARARAAVAWRAVRTLLMRSDPARGSSPANSTDVDDGARRIAAHNEQQATYFSRALLPRMVPADSPYVRRQIDEVVRAARLAPGASVLEVGAGMGRYSFGLARRGLRVECLDLTPALLDRLDAADHDGELHALHHADVAELPDELSGRFDAVVGFFTLHHMHDLAACIAGAARALAPGGRMVFCEPNAFHPLYYVQIVVTPGMTWAGDGGIVRMRPRVVLPAMRAAGLVDVTAERFGAFPPQLTNRPGGRRVESAVERLPGLGPVKPFELFIGARA